RGQWNQRTYNFADLNTVLPFDTGGIGHRLIVGVNAGKEIDDFQRTKFCAINSPGKPLADPTCNIGANQYTVSVFNPDFSAIPPPGAFGAGKLADNWILSQTGAAYLSDLITLSSHWKAMAGVRYSHDKLRVYNNRFDPTQFPFEQTTSSTLPQAGIIYQPNKKWSYYASYSESYSPVDPSTQGLLSSPLFKQTVGKGAEVGAKADLLHHRVNVTGALFLINEKNVLTPYSGGTDANCPTGSCEVQIGGARSKGVELELSAKPIEALTVIAGYAYTDAVVSESNSSSCANIVGDDLPNSPRNAFHLWSRYDVLSGAMRGFGEGLGLSYVGWRAANTGTISTPGEFILPSYTVVDLALYKDFENGLDLTMKVDNLFDETYYQDGKLVSGMVSVDAGAPRTAEIDLSWTF